MFDREKPRIRTRPAAVGLALLSVAAAALGVTAPANAIADGSDVPQGRYPFAVKLTMTDIPAGDGTRDSSCTGSLLTSQWVITAGHCFKDSAGRHVSRLVARRTTATVGRADLGTKVGRVSTVVSVRQAPGADVSLARISPPITDIAPIHLSTTTPKTGMSLRLLGFGDTGAGEPTATVLQTGTFEVVSRTSKLLGVSGRKPRAKTSPCKHDSGGPYFTVNDGQAELVAVVSEGPPCPHKGADTASRVDAVAGWITKTVGRSNLNRPAVTTPPPRPSTSAPRPSSSSALVAAPQTTGPVSPLRVGLAGAAVLLTVVVVAAMQRQTRRRRRSVVRVRSHRA